MTGLDQQSLRRILLRALMTLASGPGQAYQNQQQHQRTYRDMPGHQRLSDPVFSVEDSITKLEQLPEHQ
ncbi:hypothetical protein GPLA_2348 [Paraglaciecola polaris LMG 21857]|uniref:Uncharacterized protein n=1 Tax=Paraglaciecola polaris LMG 21857 TaxID=1129793 RepID=K6ZWT4_9ALTE|nr:hypothetical protein GPLA_2348 [Paraglaciecola polaris LMG 21857]